MAWLDDRAWCHPKLVNLTDRTFRVYINSVSYAAGMGTGGILTEAQQKLCGSDYRTRAALIKAGLWDELPVTGNPTIASRSSLAFEKLDATCVRIHDWEEHNGKRDARRKADRERKRIARGFTPKRPQDSPQDAPPDSPQDVHTPVHRTSAGQSAGPARVEGSEEELTKAVTSTTDPSRARARNPAPEAEAHETNGPRPDHQDPDEQERLATLIASTTDSLRSL